MAPKRRNVSTKPHGIASQYTVKSIKWGKNTGRANTGKFTQRDSVWHSHKSWQGHNLQHNVALLSVTGVSIRTDFHFKKYFTQTIS